MSIRSGWISNMITTLGENLPAEGVDPAGIPWDCQTPHS